MKLSFSYDVCKWNSAMYPGPVVDPDKLSQGSTSSPPDVDPGWKYDPLWVCTLCMKPVLDDQGKQKYARPFVMAADKLHKEPDNWYHCEPCRLVARNDKRAVALKKSAIGTPCIDKMLVVAPGAKW